MMQPFVDQENNPIDQVFDWGGKSGFAHRSILRKATGIAIVHYADDWAFTERDQRSDV